MHQKLDSSFTSMQFASDVSQLSLRSIVQIDRLSGTWSEFLEAFGKVADCIIGIGPKCIEGKHRFHVETKFGPGNLFPPFDIPNVLAQKVSSDSQQPGSDQGCGIETSLREVESEKDFLHQIVGITSLLKASPEISVDGLLMALDDLRERQTVSAAELLD